MRSNICAIGSILLFALSAVSAGAETLMETVEP